MENLPSLRIVFMGTPEFAVASLDALVKAGCNIVGVITAPDKPAGRGMKLTESPVKKYAIRHHIPVLQPEKLKNPEFLEQLKVLQADLQVVVAFRMLPELVWNMPLKGTVNLHGSLLPQYRGAAPINWAIINGEKETGVTTFKLQHEIDTGNILLQEVIPIGDNETAGELHDRMKDIGAALLVKTVEGLATGDLRETPQEMVNGEPASPAGRLSMVNEESKPPTTDSRLPTSDFRLSTTDSRLTLKHAPKIFTATCQVNWSKTADEIHNLIRGLSPFPGAFTELGDKTLKIFRSEKEQNVPASKPGRWESNGKTYLKFACADGYIHVKDIQLEGKKRMLIEEFLRGYRFQ